MIGVRERVLKNSFHAVETCLINMFHYKFRFMYAKLIPIEVQIIWKGSIGIVSNT
jgi:hypothetical protein